MRKQVWILAKTLQGASYTGVFLHCKAMFLECTTRWENEHPSES